MFTHQGPNRNHSHNLKIATLLSFVAGFVNVTGFVSIQKLTTNVTGHFAFFVDDVYKLKFYEGMIFFVYILSFFLGAFVSNTFIEMIRKHNERNIFILPVAIEIVILSLIGLLGNNLRIEHSNVIAISLLFAMGLQNALVTKISNAVVRTTHLTGLFTDLGIEISQFLMFKSTINKRKLIETIILRWRIISFFFIGGVLAGFFYKYIQLYSLLIPSFLLIFGLVYDQIKFKFLKWKKKNNIT
ncbi:MAG: YoaK family protein [Bacteroidota bacterium]|nr:YoaK family protein [Bacteroidota bacterium]